MQILTLWDTLNKYSLQFRDWIFDNYTNPLLWVGLVVGGYIIFRAVYSTLNKD